CPTDDQVRRWRPDEADGPDRRDRRGLLRVIGKGTLAHAKGFYDSWTPQSARRPPACLAVRIPSNTTTHHAKGAAAADEGQRRRRNGQETCYPRLPAQLRLDHEAVREALRRHRGHD